MIPTQTLPSGYQKIGTFDLSKDRRLAIALNVLALFSTALSGWLFYRAIILLRPAAISTGTITITVAGLPQSVIVIAAILLLMVFYITLHEAVHGIFFWWFTRSRPVFAFRWSYAYAAAPGWFIPRNAYLIIALAPLVIISTVGLIVAAFAPANWLQAIWFVLTMNAGGAIGDVAVAIWLLRLPPSTLSLDQGSALTLFRPEA